MNEFYQSIKNKLRGSRRRRRFVILKWKITLMLLLLQGEPMPIVYRMRGLLGDATEDMVNTLDSGSGQW